MLKTVLLNLLKFIVAGALIGWLLSSGKLDFKLLAKLQDHPVNVLMATLFMLSNLVLISWRWKKILKARSVGIISLYNLVKVTWIGQFFSSVLPGSVSGDLVKVLYVQDMDQNLSKTFIFASMFIDRLMGLSGLILLTGMSSVFFYSHILENAPSMEPLLKINFVLMGLVLGGIIIFTFFHNIIRQIMRWCERRFLVRFWIRIIGLWDDLVSIKKTLIKAVLISITVQFLSVLLFWSLISPFVAGKMDFIQALAFIPIGLMTLALPVAPSGLGVGHAIFQKLFEFSGIENGASLFNIYFVVTLVLNVLGVIPYLLNRKKTN